MKWLFQSNIWEEYAYDRLLTSTENVGVDFSLVDVIPFTDYFDTIVDFVPDVVFGSNRFVEICRTKKFPTFKSFKPMENEWYPHYEWINQIGTDMTLKEFAEIGYPDDMFIKPYKEKFFTGLVVRDVTDLEKIQLATSFVDKPEEELIRVSPAKNIYKEARFFVIGGRVITGSIYKENGRGKQYALDETSNAWKQCKGLVDEYLLPDKAFVLDLGLINREDSVSSWKIVELNNLNSAGLYHCDTDAIVNALKNL